MLRPRDAVMPRQSNATTTRCRTARHSKTASMGHCKSTPMYCCANVTRRQHKDARCCFNVKMQQCDDRMLHQCDATKLRHRNAASTRRNAVPMQCNVVLQCHMPSTQCCSNVMPKCCTNTKLHQRDAAMLRHRDNMGQSNDATRHQCDAAMPNPATNAMLHPCKDVAP